jgi:hypothetical protein
MNRKELQEKKAYDPRNYEGMKGTVIREGVVLRLPYCPSGRCWMTHPGGKREQVRLRRFWNVEYGHYQLKCGRCGEVAKVWL